MSRSLGQGPRCRLLISGWGTLVTVVALAVLVCAPTAPAHRNAPVWSLSILMSRIDGARVLIGGWSRKVQIASTLCSGEGAGRRWSGVRHWKHFQCTWTVFDRKQSIARDVTFRVHTLAAKRFLITSAHFGST